MAVKVKVRHPQVFINFRGVELRDNFVDRLVRDLRKAEINVFIDAHEWKGGQLRHLLTRIKMAKIALAIFSKRYCESKWCLDELVEMNEHMKEGTLLVIPIFYNVTASDVKRAGNLYREADFNGEEGEFTILFKKMKQKHANDPVMVKKWEFALKSVTERIGLSTEVYGASIGKSIVMEVRRHLGMPMGKPLCDRDGAFMALWATSVFSFVVAPLLFPDVEFFKSGKWVWVLSFPLFVLAWHLWDRKYYNTPRADIIQLSDSSIWDIKKKHRKAWVSAPFLRCVRISEDQRLRFEQAGKQKI